MKYKVACLFGLLLAIGITAFNIHRRIEYNKAEAASEQRQK